MYTKRSHDSCDIECKNRVVCLKAVVLCLLTPTTCLSPGSLQGRTGMLFLKKHIRVRFPPTAIYNVEKDQFGSTFRHGYIETIEGS